MAFIASFPALSRLQQRPFAPPHTIRTIQTAKRSYLSVFRKAKYRHPVTCSSADHDSAESASLLASSTADTTPDSEILVAPSTGDVVSQTESDVEAVAVDSPPGMVARTSDLDPRVLFGEFLSTFLFVYLSVNSAASGTPLANSLNNAAVIAAVAASFMPVSGAHLNPAVTLALAVTNRVSLKRAIAFIPIQLAAAAAASLMTKALGIPVPFDGIAARATRPQLVQAFFTEFMPMFIIVVVVFQTAVATEREGGVGSKLAALYIGLAVLACAGTFSTGIFNPARAFGPAVAASSFAHHWIFWVGPMLGAALAALICEHLFLAPAVNRKPNSWLAALGRKSTEMGARIKTLGLAGLIAYGIMNIAYYGIVFSAMMFRFGLAGGAGGLAKAWLVTWSFSQVTKPFRLAASIALAPFIDRFLTARALARKKTS